MLDTEMSAVKAELNQTKQLVELLDQIIRGNPQIGHEGLQENFKQFKTQIDEKVQSGLDRIDKLEEEKARERAILKGITIGLGAVGGTSGLTLLLNIIEMIRGVP